MFTPYLARLLQLVRILTVVAVVGSTLLGGVTVASASTQSKDDVAALDLAAMALTPDDLMAEDIEDLSIGNAVQSTDAKTAGEFLWRLREDEGSAGAEALEEAAPDRAYMLDLVRTAQVGDPNTGTEQRVISYLFAFEDEDAAEEGFAVLADAWQSGTMEEEAADTEIGDEQLLVVGTGRDSLNNARFDRLDLLFRVESVVAGVSAETFRDAPVEIDQGQVEALAEQQAEQIEDGLDGNGPGLSNLIVRLDVPGTSAVWDSYRVRDGEALWEYTETRDELDEVQERVEDEEVVDQYRFEQVVQGETLTSFEPPLVFYSGRLTRLEDEDAAEAYMEGAIDRMAQSSVEDYEEVGDLPLDADEALGFTYRYTSQEVDFEAYRIYLRIGNDVLTLAVNTTEGLDVEPIDALAELQVECLTGDEPCIDPVRVPAELR